MEDAAAPAARQPSIKNGLTTPPCTPSPMVFHGNPPHSPSPMVFHGNASYTPGTPSTVRFPYPGTNRLANTSFDDYLMGNSTLNTPSMVLQVTGDAADTFNLPALNSTLKRKATTNHFTPAKRLRTRAGNLNHWSKMFKHTKRKQHMPSNEDTKRRLARLDEYFRMTPLEMELKLARLEPLVKERSTIISQLEVNLISSQIRITKLEATCDQSERTMKRLEASCAQADEMIKRLVNNSKDSQDRIKELDDYRVDADKKILKLQQAAETHDEQVEQLNELTDMALSQHETIEQQSLRLRHLEAKLSNLEHLEEKLGDLEHAAEVQKAKDLDGRLDLVERSTTTLFDYREVLGQKTDKIERDLRQTQRSVTAIRNAQQQQPMPHLESKGSEILPSSARNPMSSGRGDMARPDVKASGTKISHKGISKRNTDEKRSKQPKKQPKEGLTKAIENGIKSGVVAINNPITKQPKEEPIQVIKNGDNSGVVVLNDDITNLVPHSRHQPPASREPKIPQQPQTVAEKMRAALVEGKKVARWQEPVNVQEMDAMAESFQQSGVDNNTASTPLPHTPNEEEDFMGFTKEDDEMETSDSTATSPVTSPMTMSLAIRTPSSAMNTSQSTLPAAIGSFVIMAPAATPPAASTAPSITQTPVTSSAASTAQTPVSSSAGPTASVSTTLVPTSRCPFIEESDSESEETTYQPTSFSSTLPITQSSQIIPSAATTATSASISSVQQNDHNAEESTPQACESSAAVVTESHTTLNEGANDLIEGDDEELPDYEDDSEVEATPNVNHAGTEAAPAMDQVTQKTRTRVPNPQTVDDLIKDGEWDGAMDKFTI